MPSNGGGKGWTTDPETGLQQMPVDWELYLDWLLDEGREPATSKAWAEANGYNDRTVRRWKADKSLTAVGEVPIEGQPS